MLVAAVVLLGISPPAAAAPPDPVDDGPFRVDSRTSGGRQPPVTFSFTGNDPGFSAATMSVIIVTPPAHGFLSPVSVGSYWYYQTTPYSGPDSFTYRLVEDGVESSRTATVLLDVTSNAPPTALADSAVVDEDSSVSIGVIANDSDPELGRTLLSIGSISAPAHGTAVRATGMVERHSRIIYTPAPDYSGPDSFTYVAQDAHGWDSAPATVTVNVRGVNDRPSVERPVWWRDSLVVGVPVSREIVATDPDGDDLTYTAEGLPAGLAIDPRSGMITGTPEKASLNHVQVTVADGHGGTDLTLFPWNVWNGSGEPNVAPVIVNSPGTQASALNAEASLRIEAIDYDGDTLSFSATGLPPGLAIGVGREVIPGLIPGVISGAPSALGRFSVTVTVSDGRGGEASVSFDWVVNPPPPPPNRAPVMTYPGWENRVSTVGDVVSLQIEASDPDGDPLTYIADGLPTGLSVDEKTGLISGTLTAEGNFRIVNIWVYDGQLHDWTNFDWRVDPATHGAPTVQHPGDQVSTVGSEVSLQIEGSDPDGQPLTYSATGLPPGLAIDAGSGQISGAPSLVDSFSVTVTVSSAKGGEASTSFEWVVSAVPNRAPVVTNPGDRASTVGEVVSLQIEASDPDGDRLAYGATGLPAGLAIDAQSGKILGSPSTVGDSRVAVTVRDERGDEATTAFAWAVLPPNVVPSVAIEVGDTTIPDSDRQPGEAVEFRGLAEDTDGVVETASYRWTVNDEAITAADGQSNPTLALRDGSNTVALSATDDRGGVGSASVTVTVGAAVPDLVLPDLPESLRQVGVATVAVCRSLEDAHTLTPAQRDLQATCRSLVENAGDDPQTVQALEQISGRQVTALQTTAIDFSTAQLMNLDQRLEALRQGARGFSAAGLAVSAPGLGAPLPMLASLTRTLVGDEDVPREPPFDGRLAVFMNGAVRVGGKDPTEREAGFDFDTWGVTLGVDYRFDEAVVAGLALGYGSADADFDDHAGTQDSDSFTGSLYGTWYSERGYLEGVAGYGGVSFETIRKIDLFDGAVVDRIFGETDGDQWMLALAGGYDFGAASVRFGPNLALDYIRVDIDGFREDDLGSGLALVLGDQTGESLVVKAGGHVNYSLSRDWGTVSPYARLDLAREFMNDSSKMWARYANDPTVAGPGASGGRFVIFTDDPDEYYLLWAVGATLQLRGGFSGFVHYESVEGLDTISSSELSFGLGYETRFR